MPARSSTGFVQLILGPHAFDQVFLNASIEVYSGAQPDNADLAATGTLLARITRNGGAWTEGSSPNGLQFVRSGRYAFKDPAHEWRMVGVATGTAGWWRLRANAPDTAAASLLLPRIDGAVRLDGSETAGQLTLTNVSITPATNTPINHWWYAIPPLGD